jgi:hypothetical protein
MNNKGDEVAVDFKSKFLSSAEEMKKNLGPILKSNYRFSFVKARSIRIPRLLFKMTVKMHNRPSFAFPALVELLIN